MLKLKTPHTITLPQPPAPTLVIQPMTVDFSKLLTQWVDDPGSLTVEIPGHGWIKIMGAGTPTTYNPAATNDECIAALKLVIPFEDYTLPENTPPAATPAPKKFTPPAKS
jgi:hypothetical protein